MTITLPSHRLVIDWESYYDSVYSLKLMTTQEYILDPRFETLGLSFQLDEREAVYLHADHRNFRAVIDALPWEDSLVVAHNANFDGGIAEWIYGKKPHSYFCTMQAANAVSKPFNGRASLAKTAEYYGLPPKGTFINNMVGKHLCDLTPQEREEMRIYGSHDTRLCGWIHDRQTQVLPMSEKALINLTVKKFTRGRLRLDKRLIQVEATIVKERKAKALAKFGATPEQVKKTLMSNNLFAEALMELGVTPPMKVSEKTQKRAYAFAKTDTGLTDLLEHPDTLVQTLVAARLETKSTLEETRLNRFLRLAALDTGLAVPLNYYGAHTGRFSGADNLNFQNLPRDSALRRAIVAPPGYVVLTADFSQIECRILACLAGEHDLIVAFAQGKDVYCEFASKIFRKLITKADKPERRLGKTGVLGLGFGTGATKFHDTCASQGIKITEKMAQDIVNLYRRIYARVPQLWSQCEGLLTCMMAMEGVPVEHRPHRVFSPANLVAAPGRIELPNGMHINYPDLKYVQGEENEWTYRVPKRGAGSRASLYGAKIVEHLCQSLARIVMTNAELLLAKRGLLAEMTVHDELVYLVRIAQVERVKQALQLAMCEPPWWMPNLPLACEIGVGDSYGAAGDDK